MGTACSRSLALGISEKLDGEGSTFLHSLQGKYNKSASKNTAPVCAFLSEEAPFGVAY